VCDTESCRSNLRITHHVNFLASVFALFIQC